jgi:FAD/FMN-containing dehydrogenase
MRGVQIGLGPRRARPGRLLWGEVAAAAAEHWLTGLAASSSIIGIAGYSIGGGVGWLARLYRLAANSVLAADVVTANGLLVRTGSRSLGGAATAGPQSRTSSKPAATRLTSRSGTSGHAAQVTTGTAHNRRVLAILHYLES